MAIHKNIKYYVRIDNKVYEEETLKNAITTAKYFISELEDSYSNNYF